MSDLFTEVYSASYQDHTGPSEDRKTARQKQAPSTCWLSLYAS